MRRPKKWRPRFSRRSPWGRKRKVNRTYHDQYVRDLILRDAEEMGGSVSVKTLTFHAPGRYDRRYLSGALKAMKQSGDLHLAGGWGRSVREPVYWTREKQREYEAERRAA